MRRTPPALLLSLALALPFSLPGRAVADGEASPPEAGAEGGAEASKKKPADRPKTVEAVRGPFTVEQEVAATFGPRDAVEVRYEPEQYGGALEVVEAVGAGPVVKGQVLARFETREIDRQLEVVRADLAIARAAAAKQEEEAKRQEESTELQLAQGRLEKERADEALRHFQEIWMPLRKAEATQGMQAREDGLKDQEEELAQLEKMYEADDLTEETEDIVLRRSRRNLERARRSLEFARQRFSVAMDVDLPRELESLQLQQRRQANAWDRLQATARLGLEQSRLELEKARLSLRRQEEAHARLQADRDALLVTAPVSGFAVPGAFAGGKWGSYDDLSKALLPGRKAPAKAVLYTVFRPGALLLSTSVDEATVLKVREGQSGTAAPRALPDLSIPVTVSRVSRVSADGRFDVELSLGEADERLLPGYGAKVTLELETKASAVTVPAGAVGRDGEKAVVHVLDGEQVVARPVKTGATCDGRTEILEGLQGGERVLEKAPKS